MKIEKVKELIAKSGYEEDEVYIVENCHRGNIFVVKTKCGIDFMDYGDSMDVRYKKTGSINPKNMSTFREEKLKTYNLTSEIRRLDDRITVLKIGTGNYPAITFEFGKRMFSISFRQLKQSIKNGFYVNTSYDMYDKLEELGIDNIEILKVYTMRRKSNEAKYELYLDIMNKQTLEVVHNVQWRRMWVDGYHFKKSTGEIAVEKTLKKLGLTFEKQKMFKNCKLQLPLRFDFYVPSLNTCIEYDGEYHYKDIRGTLEYTQIRDAIKNKYCAENNIALIRIPYFEKENIYKIIEEIV
jgi:hypothetical protein